MCAAGLRWALFGLVLLSGCKGWQFPLSAGPSIIRCYSRVGASSSELKQAMQAVWDKYPENRVDSATLEQLRVIERAERNGFSPPVPSEPVSRAEVANAFHRQGQTGGHWETWVLKTAGNESICYLSIANCSNASSRCDICFMAARFLPPTARAADNTGFSVKERAQLQTWFEQDILRKIAVEVRDARLR